MRADRREAWVSPEERHRLEAEEHESLRREAEPRKRAAEESPKRGDAKRGADDEKRVRQEVEAERQVDEQEKLRKEPLAKERGYSPTFVRGLAGAFFPSLALEKQGSSARINASPLTTAQERALKVGDSFKEGPNCPEMIVVPAGRLWMGSPKGQGDDDEHPQRLVTIARHLAVAKFALTFEEWDACAALGGCRPDVGDSGWGRGRRPAINVSWDDAQAYVKWLSGITGKPYRLLSEAEYEYAARAGSQTAYPWGDAIKLDGKTMANCANCGSQWDDKRTAPVGSFAPNRFGLYDMIGNVWEWTEDCWNDTYQGAPTDGSAWTAGDCNRRVVRGGSWNYGPDLLRSALRDWFTTGLRLDHVGFRVARTLSL